MPQMKPRIHPFYGPLIKEFTGCTDEQTIAVEEVMRAEKGTLDAITRPAFKRLAKSAFEAAKQLGMLK